MKPPYRYKAKITNIVDGDTVDAVVDLGFTVSVDIRFRLYGIDTPELRSSDESIREEAKKAKQFVIDKLFEREVLIDTYKTDKYGRWLAEILYEDTTINKMLIDEGLATPYYGGTKG